MTDCKAPLALDRYDREMATHTRLSRYAQIYLDAVQILKTDPRNQRNSAAANRAAHTLRDAIERELG